MSSFLYVHGVYSVPSTVPGTGIEQGTTQAQISAPSPHAALGLVSRVPNFSVGTPGLPSHPSGPSRDLSFHHSLVPLLAGPSPPQMASSVLKTEPARLSLALDCEARAGPSSPSPLLAGCSRHLSYRSLPPCWLYFMGYLPIQPKPTAASCPGCTAPLLEGRHGLPPASSFKHRVCG